MTRALQPPPDRTERLPRNEEWLRVPLGALLTEGCLSASAWQRGATCVISALEHAELPDKSGIGPQWHLSVSRRGKRPTTTDIKQALRAFGMKRAEEDNHHPGNARHFWIPVDPAHRVDCECKTDEQTIVEADGYAWTNPRPDEGACRGCEAVAITGRPCPLHTEVSP